jgi:hypothetical protein
MKPKENRLDISENELLEYITQEAHIIPRRPEGFGVTIEEFKDYAGIGFREAKRKLEELVKSGKLQSQTMRHVRHISTIYFEPKKK